MYQSCIFFWTWTDPEVGEYKWRHLHLHPAGHRLVWSFWPGPPKNCLCERRLNYLKTAEWQLASCLQVVISRKRLLNGVLRCSWYGPGFRALTERSVRQRPNPQPLVCWEDWKEWTGILVPRPNVINCFSFFVIELHTLTCSHHGLLCFFWPWLEHSGEEGECKADFGSQSLVEGLN